MKTLGELFDIRYGVNLEVVNCEVVESGGIPFVSRQSVNNGIACHVRELPYEEPNPAGTLSIAGGGSVLSTFLQEKLPWGLVPYMQALLLARHIRGDLDAYPPFLWT